MSSLTSRPATADAPASVHAPLKILGHICFVGGFLLVLASVAVWFHCSTPDPSHRERIAIFVGL